MAIYHLSVKTVSRSAGRSATAAAAYRAGVRIADNRTGEVFDYRRRKGVVSRGLLLPAGAPKWAADRAELWNRAELAETRKNSTVAREFEVALPAELSAPQRQELAHAFALELVAKHGFAADVAIHVPDTEGDERNHHAHILCTTRRLAGDGFTEKTRELDERTSGQVDAWRERFATLTNAHLARHGHAARVDHRSLADQGAQRPPTRHLGPGATGIERKTGQASARRQAMEADMRERAQEAAAERIAAANEEAAIAAAEAELLQLQEDLRRQPLARPVPARRAAAAIQAEIDSIKRPEPLDQAVKNNLFVLVEAGQKRGADDALREATKTRRLAGEAFVDAKKRHEAAMKSVTDWHADHRVMSWLSRLPILRRLIGTPAMLLDQAEAAKLARIQRAGTFRTADAQYKDAQGKGDQAAQVFNQVAGQVRQQLEADRRPVIERLARLAEELQQSQAQERAVEARQAQERAEREELAQAARQAASRAFQEAGQAPAPERPQERPRGG